MHNSQNSKSFIHFTKHLFLVSKVYIERNKAKQDVDEQLEKMRKAIINMRLSYTDVDRLKQKIENLIKWERKYAKFFKPKDEEAIEFKNQIFALEQELKKEKGEKLRIIDENQEKIKQLTDSLDNIKNNLKHLHLEKAKREHRLRDLEHKISKKVNAHEYYNS